MLSLIQDKAYRNSRQIGELNKISWRINIMSNIKHAIEEVVGHTPILELDGLEKK